MEKPNTYVLLGKGCFSGESLPSLKQGRASEASYIFTPQKRIVIILVSSKRAVFTSLEVSLTIMVINLC